MKKRLLITGSRHWESPEIVFEALSEIVKNPADWILVSGHCPTGADAFAENFAKSVKMEIEPHPADWKKYGRFADPRRNREMVDAGADLCCAFLTPDSIGGAKTASWAKQAGIETHIFQL